MGPLLVIEDCQSLNSIYYYSYFIPDRFNCYSYSLTLFYPKGLQGLSGV
jgi:hypothetical protein